LVPVPGDNGVNDGYLKSAEGIISNGAGPGVDRGGINWNNVCYRVMGSKFVKVLEDGTVSIIGDVGDNGDFASMDYGFDLLAIVSANRLFYYDGATLSENTSPNLGLPLSVRWIDGYFMIATSTAVLTTELNDPFTINVFSYDASEVDPDPILSTEKLRNEAYFINRYTIEVFANRNSPDSFFPYSRVSGAQIPKGCVGTFASCIYKHKFLAFVGGGKNEQPSVYLGVVGEPRKIASKEVEDLLESYTESQLSSIKIEARNQRASDYLYIHLPDRTLVYDEDASGSFGQPVWHILTSALEGFGQYRARSFVYCYNKWLVADPQSSNIGYLDEKIMSHWGEIVRWECSTKMIYNEGRILTFPMLELLALTGRVEIDKDPQVSTSYSLDGMTWSVPKFRSAGKIGDRNIRIKWTLQGYMKNWRIQRFRGNSQANISLLRVEANLNA